jgi:hypothetical protein
MIMTVAGTVAKNPGLCTSTSSRMAPPTMSSHPKDIPISGSTMITVHVLKAKILWDFVYLPMVKRTVS